MTALLHQRAYTHCPPPLSRSFTAMLQPPWMNPQAEPLVWCWRCRSPPPVQEQTERRWAVVRKFSSSLEEIHKKQPMSARRFQPKPDPPLKERPSSGAENGQCACRDRSASDADADSLTALRAIRMHACTCVRLRARSCVRRSPTKVAQHIPFACHRLRCATRSSCYLIRAVASGLSLVCLWYACASRAGTPTQACERCHRAVAQWGAELY